MTKRVKNAAMQVVVERDITWYAGNAGRRRGKLKGRRVLASFPGLMPRWGVWP